MPLFILLQRMRVHFHRTSAAANGFRISRPHRLVVDELRAIYVSRAAECLDLTELNIQLAKYLIGTVQHYMMPDTGRGRFHDISVR